MKINKKMNFKMMEINEKYGIVKKTTHKWDNLVDMIINYLYDINGLQNDIDMLND